MVRAYKSILEEGINAYSHVIQHIIDNPDSAILVHCTAGKDRTGVICAVILSFCGVEDSVIAEEYTLTEQGLEPWRDMIIDAVVRSKNSTRDQARRMAGARKRSILGSLNML